MKNALKQATINNLQIQSLIVRRQTYNGLKKRLDAMEAILKDEEARLIQLLETGAQVRSPHALSVRVFEKRYPSWKSYFTELAGTEAVERVLDETTPTIYKSLHIL